MRKIKVSVLIDQLIPGGVQKIAIQEVKYLNKLGYEANLLILMRDGYQPKYRALVKDIPHRFSQDSYPFIFRKNFRLPFFSFLSTLHFLSPILTIKQLKNNNPHIIISHGSTTSLTAAAAKILAKIPYIFMIHDPMVYILEKIYSNSPLKIFSLLIKFTATYLEKKIIKNAQICVIDSRFHQKFIKEKYGITPQVLYLATEIGAKPLKKLGKSILTTGRWGKGKNLQLLLEILPTFPKTKLIVAGIWGNHRDLVWFKNLVSKKGLAKQVKLITYYQDRDLPKIAKEARVWVLPHQEAFSISALEAASMGLPIIIPTNSGVTDLFKNHQDGIFPKKMTAKTLLAGLKTYLNDENLAKTHGRSAAQKARKFYSPIHHCRQLSNLISELAPPRKIVALEAGHVGKIGIAGGDLLLSKMFSRLKNPPRLEVIIPQANTAHWQKIKRNVEIIPLKHTFLDEATSPFLVLTNYLARIARITPKVIKAQNNTIIYSSTDTLPDVIPAAIAKIVSHSYYWIARVHHLSPSPLIRPGNFLINVGSAFMQKISTYAIRKGADTVLVLNKSLKETLAKRGFAKKKLQILEGGVDYRAISRFQPASREGFNAVYLGRIHATKGAFDLPRIWSIVVAKNPSASLAIIGTGSQNNIKNLQKMVAISKLEKNVKVLGFISQKRLWTILKNSKVFLFCDHEAGFGLAVAEAMAAGLPVIGYDIGILGDVFKAGYVKIPLSATGEFAQSIIKLLQNSSLQKKLAKDAQEEAARHDWQKVALKFRQILDTIDR